MRSKKPAAAVAALVCGSLALAGCGGGPSAASGKLSNDKVVLALLNDQSGIYKDVSGPNSKVAIEMAIEDYKAKYGDKAVARTIEIVSADHQNKADVANTKAQEMYDRQNADIILDVPNSPSALAVAGLAKAKKKLYINVSAATTELSGAACNKYTFHWAYDSNMLATGIGEAMVKRGGMTWSIVYPDSAFGESMNKSFTASVTGAGGSVQQSIQTPTKNSNFTTFITRAGSTNPKVIGTMAAGGDLINFVKQFNQADMRDKATLAVGLMFITDIHSLGVDQFAGTTFTDFWYWNLDAENRAWADKFKAKTNTRPTSANAGNYSAALQYLEAVQRAGTDNSDAVVKELEGKDLKDVFLRNGTVRAADHRVLHDAYVSKVKAKDQVKDEWDVEEILSTIPADKAFGPVSAACKM